MEMSEQAQGGRVFRVRRLGLADPDDSDLQRSIPIEAPVAIEYNGIGYAVMMATPIDLEAYGIGFTLAEGLVESASVIKDVIVHFADGGWIIRITLPPECVEPVVERARVRASESSCGLCGIETIEQVLRSLPPLGARIKVGREAIARALAALRDHQPLGRATGAAHAAAFCSRLGEILVVKEDVGRHNALDKLIGTLALDGIDPAIGFFLLSARCSYELVEKTVRAGCPMLVTISAPTSLAIERAARAGLTLLALARPDSVLVLNDPHGGIS
jgi:FdhD protein